MDSMIPGRVLYCSKLFERAPVEDLIIQEARKLFVEWNAISNADRAGTGSLDERLRDAPDRRDTTLELLDTLVLLLKGGAGSKQSPDTNNSSELNEALDSLADRASIFEVVKSLIFVYFFIPASASVDMYVYEKAKNVNVDDFVPIDKSYIEQRFPKADPVLRDRLLQATLSRRKRLRYAEEGKEESAKEAPSQQDEEQDEDWISDCDDDGAASGIMSIPVPPMPPTGQEGKPFKCPCCFSMIVAKNQKEWKRHVFSDILPYVCTFADCKEPDRLFASGDWWCSHELNYHRRMWICIEGCSEQFDSKSAFEAHWSDAHEEIGDIAQAEKRGAHNTRLPQPEISTCPMCHDEIRRPESVMTHIGRHQVELALWTLHSMRHFDGEDDQEGDEEDGAKISDEKDKVPDNPAPSQDAAGSDSLPPGSREPWLSSERDDYWICDSPDDLGAAASCLDERWTNEQ